MRKLTKFALRFRDVEVLIMYDIVKKDSHNEKDECRCLRFV